MLPIVGIVSLGSLGYLGYSANEYAKYRKFIKSKVDGQYHLVEGKITSPHIGSFETVKVDHLYYNLLINKIQKKTGTRMVEEKVGNHSYSYPEKYTYNDSTTIFKEIWYKENLKIEKINIGSLDKTKVVVDPTETKLYPIQGVTRMDMLGIDYKPLNLDKAYKLKFTEYIVRNGEHVTIFGTKKSINFVQPLCIGNKKLVHDFVRTKFYRCKYGGVGIAFTTLFVSGLIFYDNYDEYPHY